MPTPSQAPVPDLPRVQALANEGHRLRETGDLDGAERAFRQAAALAPAAAALQHNIGLVLQLRGDYPRAEQAFRGALDLEPGRPVSRAALGAVLLGQGRYVEGFPLYGAWRETPEHRAIAAGAGGLLEAGLKVPTWRGEKIAGKRLLILSEEGFGDQIMYARFAKLAQQAGASVVWLCSPPLARLFEHCLGVLAAPWDRAGDLGAFDYCIPSSGLAERFFPPLQTPPSAAYLQPPKPSIAPGLTLGVVTRGSPTHQNDRNRSLSAELAAELLALPGAVDLAPENTGARDFHDTACVIAGLDLVISVDTSVVHLAGALGKPCWVLLPAYGTDWRWLQGRSDSPWYNSLRLFRQPQPGLWAPVLDQVRAALAEDVANRRQRPAGVSASSA